MSRTTRARRRAPRAPGSAEDLVDGENHVWKREEQESERVLEELAAEAQKLNLGY